MLISLVLGLALALVGAPWCAAESPQMSAWYPFDSEEAIGQSVGANPWPAYPLHGEVTAGKFGSARSVPGVGGNGLYLPNPAGFFGGEAHRGAIAMWVKPGFDPAEETGQRVIIDFMKQAGNTLIDGYEIVIFTDKEKLTAWPALGRRMVMDSPLRQGEWTHLALTWDDQEGTAVYVDGEKRAERKGKFKPTALEKGWPGRVGCHTPSGRFPFAGCMDELRLFNYRLSDEEVRLIKDLRTPAPALKITGDWIEEVSVRNEGAEAIKIRLQAWLPGKHVAPPFLGYLPFGFGSVSPDRLFWVAGATTVEACGETVTLEPGEETRFTPPGERYYLGPRTIRLMAGEGVAAAEVGRGAFGGLSIEPTRFRPLVYRAGARVVLGARAENDMGRSFGGVVRAELRTLDGEDITGPIGPMVPLAMRHGVRRLLSFTLDDGRLKPGSYRLKLVAVEKRHRSVINELLLHITKDEDSRTICDVGAAYVRRVDDPAVLEAMAEDGVAVLRLGGSGNYYSFEKNMTALLRHGFKVWRTPAASYRSVCTSEESRERLRATARNMGRYFRDNPAVINQSIAGEGLTYPPCYCEDCNQSFRAYLRKKYGALEKLNAAWGSGYGEWSEIQQLGSPQDIDEAAERLKMMQVALELPEGNTQRWRKLFELDKTRAIEWKRWHDEVLVDWYGEFAKAFHETNEHRTPIGEQPCWPNFKTHVLFALGEIADTGGMDLYLPGEMPTTLGYAAELFLNFDMNASIFHAHGKPVMVHELYVQDNSPALLPEAQGWWLVGRGYNLLTYFTYNYYHEGTRAKLPLIFGMFDKEGKPYPCYDSFVRFSRDIKRFHGRYDYTTLRREEPRVALFMGDDVSLANCLESGGATWNAAGVHGHNGAYWLTERCGFPVEFINDERFDRLEGKRALIVPWCHVIRRGSIEKMLGFARGGGALIIDGPLGLYDEAYRPYEPLPGGTLSEALKVSFAGYEDKPNKIVVREGVEVASQGIPVGLEVNGAKVLFSDTEGRPAVVEVPMGRGKIVFFLSSLGRRNRSRAPDGNALVLWKSALEGAGLRSRWGLRSKEATPAEADENLDHGGAGLTGKASLFDASFRIKDDTELLVFLVSFFGPTEGTLELLLPPGKYGAWDALSGEAVELSAVGGGWWIPVELPAFGSAIVRIKAEAGRPFASW